MFHSYWDVTRSGGYKMFRVRTPYSSPQSVLHTQPTIRAPYSAHNPYSILNPTIHTPYSSPQSVLHTQLHNPYSIVIPTIRAPYSVFHSNLLRTQPHNPCSILSISLIYVFLLSMSIALEHRLWVWGRCKYSEDLITSRTGVCEVSQFCRPMCSAHVLIPLNKLHMVNYFLVKKRLKTWRQIALNIYACAKPCR